MFRVGRHERRRRTRGTTNASDEARRKKTDKRKNIQLFSVLTIGTRSKPRPCQPPRRWPLPSAIALRGERQEQLEASSQKRRRESFDANDDDADVNGMDESEQAKVREKRLSCRL